MAFCWQVVMLFIDLWNYYTFMESTICGVLFLESSCGTKELLSEFVDESENVSLTFLSCLGTHTCGFLVIMFYILGQTKIANSATQRHYEGSFSNKGMV